MLTHPLSNPNMIIVVFTIHSLVYYFLFNMAESQPSLSSFKEQFDNQLTCNVCLDQYTDPKVLPCHHSFCLECIQLTPTIIKDGNYYISCPTCRVNHLIPEGGAINLPNAFHINSFIDSRKSLAITKSAPITCPKHNYPLKEYCETCRQVICCECTISKEHNTHKFELISECYPKHTTYEKAALNVLPCLAKQPSTATLTLHSQDGSPVSLPPSLISSTLSSSGDTHSVKCDITQTHQTGKYNIAFTPSTIFNNNLTFSHTITHSDNEQFDSPCDVSVDNEGYLYVVEFGNHCITKLTTKGQYVTRFGSKGSAPGQLSNPTSLTINNGLVYVTERGNNRVSIFDINGTFLHLFGKRGSGEGEFNEPDGITIDTLGNLYVSDIGNERIVVF